jgi:hypothetical protein
MCNAYQGWTNKVLWLLIILVSLGVCENVALNITTKIFFAKEETND